MNIIQQGVCNFDDCKFTLNNKEKSLLQSKLLKLVHDSYKDDLKHRDMKILVWLLTSPNTFTEEHMFYTQDTLTRIQEILNS